MAECTSAGENPYTAPASAEPTALTRHRRSTQNMAVADPANPAVVRTVRLTCGPSNKVRGVSSTPGSSSDVFHIKLTPVGAFIALVTRAGRCPWLTAVAAYRRYHPNRSASPALGATNLDAGSAHSRQVRRIAPAR